ncbi:hypothetical protein HDV05_004573 [Chytridiales sp. JEL 0842]|nr:hypothetical protein HDV05_004573 [Chytridiales sp. JEL 0842]
MRKAPTLPVSRKWVKLIKIVLIVLSIASFLHFFTAVVFPMHSDPSLEVTDAEPLDNAKAKVKTYGVLKDWTKNRRKNLCSSRPTEAARFEGVSLVTAVMNQGDSLADSLCNWLQITGVNEIIIVDWSSQRSVLPAIAKALVCFRQSATFFDVERLLNTDDEEHLESALQTFLASSPVPLPRLKVITVPHQTQLLVSSALNLAAFHSSGSHILHASVDVFFTSDFLQQYPLLSSKQAKFVMQKLSSGTDRSKIADLLRQVHNISVNAKYLPSFQSIQGYFYGGIHLKSDRTLHPILLATREAYFSVNGYDERIAAPELADDNLNNRLKSFGYQQLFFRAQDVKYKTAERPGRLTTNKNQDAQSTENREFYPSVEHLVTKELLRTVPSWGCSDTILQCNMKTRYTARAMTPLSSVNPYPSLESLVCEPKAQPPSFEEVLGSEKFSSLYRSAQQRVLSRVANISTDFLETILTPSRLNSMLELYVPHQPRYIVINAQYGLGNRLRAIASARVLAQMLDRKLRIVWVIDEHCRATFADLFKTKWGPENTNEPISEHPFPIGDEIDVVSEFDPRELNTDFFDVYDYMKNTSAESRTINSNTSKHIYIKSAFRLVSPLFTAAERSRFQKALRSLTPADTVQELISSVTDALAARNISTSSIIGMHIRNMSPKDKQDIEDLDDKTYSEKSLQTLVTHRKSCQTQLFVERAETLLKNDPSLKFYLSADDQAAYATIVERFGQFGPLVIPSFENQGGEDGKGVKYKGTPEGRIIFIERSCKDRGPFCLRYALADIILLGRSKWILGSVWSSFTEVAAARGGLKWINGCKTAAKR